MLHGNLRRAGALPNLYVEPDGHVKAELFSPRLHLDGKNGMTNGTAPLVAQFDKIGIGQWFRYVTAACQLLGGAVLIIPKYSGYGALLLACVLIGGIVLRLTVLGGNPTLAVALLLVTGLTAWKRLKVK